MASVIGIDSSTQSVKVEIRDLATGKVHGRGRAAHPPTSPPRSEQDPDAWWTALVRATQLAGPRDDVVAVAVAGQQHGLVATDRDGDPVAPAKLWNDTESAPQAARLVDELGAGAWAQATGSVPGPAFTITKLAWLAEERPEAFARATRVSLPHDWLTLRMSGNHVTDRGDASGTGYWSPPDGRWRTDLLDRIAARPWGSMLPQVLGPFDIAGTLTPPAATELGLPSSALVAPGTGDNMAAAVGLGLRPGDVVVSLGTSGTVYAISDTPTADPSGAVAGYADAAGRFLPLVCTLNATKVTDAVARLLGTDHDGFTALALDAPLGSDGLVVVPYFDGERTPNRPHATGTITGIRSDVSRAQLARASVEGVVCGLLDGVDALARIGVPVDGRLLLVGGGSRSPAYRQVVADMTQRTVLVPAADEHVAAGACVQAAAVYARHTGDDAGADVDEIAQRWGLGTGPETTPAAGTTSELAAAARSAFAATRDAVPDPSPPVAVDQ